MLSLKSFLALCILMLCGTPLLASPADQPELLVSTLAHPRDQTTYQTVPPDASQLVPRCAVTIIPRQKSSGTLDAFDKRGADRCRMSAFRGKADMADL
jgi:hypothetical protein